MLIVSGITLLFLPAREGSRCNRKRVSISIGVPVRHQTRLPGLHRALQGYMGLGSSGLQRHIVR